MKSVKNYLLLLLGVLVAGLALLAWRQSQELIALRGTVLTNGERADWQGRVWAAQKRAQHLETELAAARTAKPETAAVTAGPEAGPPSRAAMGRMMSGFASLMDRPEAARLMALQQKAQIDSRYAALFKKLSLPPDKLAQLKGLLGDWLSAPIDVLTAGAQQGINPMQDPQAFRQLVQSTQAEIDDKIKSLLDPASYATYQNYVQTEPQRTVVNQLQQSLSYTDTPLTPAQADQLVQILAQTSPSRGPVGGGAAVSYVARTGSGGQVAAVAVGPPPADGGPLMAAGGSLVTDAAVTQAQAVLSTPQLQALQQIQQQQQAAAQLRQQIFQSATAVGVAPPPPPPPPGG
ncbi:MAG TPA: hypothetical protein VMF63_06860 [Opitutaceae bacterium]|nr:hypothetical protein [Opitutaceae bacterium]